MGKFKFSKRAYLSKVKQRKDWEGGEGQEKGRPPVNKTMSCHRYVDLNGNRAFSKAVEIKDRICSASATCHADCSYR